MLLAESVKTYAEWTGVGLELLALAVLSLGIVTAMIRGALEFLQRREPPGAYSRLRNNIARVTLLALELLVAADIVATIAVDLSFRRLGLLGLIVLVRTFLSFALEIEIEGRLPWRREKSNE